MDFLASLQGEIAAKKKKMAEVAGESTYVRIGDVEAQRQKAYEEEQRRLEEKRLAKKKERHERTRSQASKGSKSDSEGESARREADPEVLKIPAKDVIRNLRRRGEPIRLFGESDDERVLRLRALEAAQPEIDGQLNEFRQQISNLDHALDVEALKRKAEEEDEVLQKDDDEGKKRRKLFESLATERITADMFEHDRDKLCALTHDYFKRLLMEWEDDLNKRPEHVKRSMQGKTETVTMHHAHEYMKPFFHMLKTKSMPDDVLVNLGLICQYMQEREYVKANNTYYLLSIGNAPWPIGVTMVGIHERSAREKIFSHQVAHVLNDEKTRKWIQSMKRLMTFCQNKYLPEDLSKTAGWIKN